MKKSNKEYSVTTTKNGSSITKVEGTRSGIANYVRQMLEDVEKGTVTFSVDVREVPTPQAAE